MTKPLLPIQTKPQLTVGVKATDDALLRRLTGCTGLRAALPAEALAVVEDWYED